MKCETCKHYWNNGKDEYCDKRGWDFKRNGCPDFASKYKPKTNYDLLIRKTPKELAEFIYKSGYGSCPQIPVCPQFASGKMPYTEDECKACWLDWLKQEADNE